MQHAVRALAYVCRNGGRCGGSGRCCYYWRGAPTTRQRQWGSEGQGDGNVSNEAYASEQEERSKATGNNASSAQQPKKMTKGGPRRMFAAADVLSGDREMSADIRNADNGGDRSMAKIFFFGWLLLRPGGGQDHRPAAVAPGAAAEPGGGTPKKSTQADRTTTTATKPGYKRTIIHQQRGPPRDAPPRLRRAPLAGGACGAWPPSSGAFCFRGFSCRDPFAGHTGTRTYARSSPRAQSCRAGCCAPDYSSGVATTT